MEQTGKLQIWIAINALHPTDGTRAKYKTIETVHDLTENGARESFQTWRELNTHMPFACAKWVPYPVIIR